MKAFAALLTGLLIAGCSSPGSLVESPESAIEVIAFGSCAKEDREQPVWDHIVAASPDLFLFTGDNIYGDTEDMAVMRAKYALLAGKPGFQKLRATCPIVATWDDHDYGVNDGGAEYPKKVESQKEFLRFFGIPESSPMWKQEGVYNAHLYGPRDRRVQVILLDTRYHRGPLQKWPAGPRPTAGPYKPSDDPTSTMLGEEQWRWFEEQLRVPARLRIVVTSIQALSRLHGSESWGNLPRERDRLFATIERTGARGVVLISGDRHMSEIARMDTGDPDSPGYPIYEITSSGLTQFGGGRDNEENPYRISAGNYRKPNFGLLQIDWSAKDPILSMEIRDVEGKGVYRYEAPLGQLSRRR